MRRFTVALALALSFGLLITACDSGLTGPSEPSARADRSPAGQTAAQTSAETPAQDQRLFRVEQGDDCFCVTALSTGETVEAFYGYDPPHSHTSTDIERSMTSNLFLFKGPKGTSLVALHDKGDDEHTHGTDDGGGAATFKWSRDNGAPPNWVVQDDGSDFEDKNDDSPDWAWAEQHTDGGASRGGLDGDFALTITPAFNDAAERSPLTNGDAAIEKWHVLSGDASDPERVSLALDEPVTISTKCTEVDIDIKPGGGPNAINPDSRGVVPVAILHTEAFDPATIDTGTIRFGDPDDVGVVNGIFIVDGIADPGGATPAHGGHLEDVDGDGDDDLVLHFPTQDADFEGDENTGTLIGETTDGVLLGGSASITLVGGGPSGIGEGAPGGEPGGE